MLPAPTIAPGADCATHYFDGTSDTDLDAVATENINAAGEGYTLSAWVLRANAAGPERAWERIIDFGNGPGQQNVLVAFDPAGGSGDSLRYYCNVGGNWPYVAITDPFPHRQWSSFQLTHATSGDVVVCRVAEVGAC